MIDICKDNNYTWNGLSWMQIVRIVFSASIKFEPSFHRFRSVSTEDLLQESLLYFEKAKSQYDPSRGASPATFLRTTTENALCNYWTYLKAKKRAHEKGDIYLEDLNKAEISDSETNDKTRNNKINIQDSISQCPDDPQRMLENNQLREMIEQRRKGLDESDQAVIEDLLSGHSMSEACQRNGRPKTTMYDRLRRIFPREMFEEFLK